MLKSFSFYCKLIAFLFLSDRTRSEIAGFSTNTTITPAITRIRYFSDDLMREMSGNYTYLNIKVISLFFLKKEFTEYIFHLFMVRI